MLGEIVHRALYGIALPQLIQMLRHQLRFQSRRLIVVDPGTLLIGQLVPTAVVVVVAQNGDGAFEALDQIVHQCGFAAAGTAGNAKDKDIFLRVIAPATLPFILTAIRLGASVALTTLIAAESTGAFAGLGMRIRSFNNSYEVEPMLLYIILIGIIGITIEKVIKFLEKKLTGWQETREV